MVLGSGFKVKELWQDYLVSSPTIIITRENITTTKPHVFIEAGWNAIKTMIGAAAIPIAPFQYKCSVHAPAPPINKNTPSMIPTTLIAIVLNLSASIINGFVNS
jgi:hypothetical protein